MSKSLQEKFWSGDFGDQYISRNNDPQIVVSNTFLFSEILRRLPPINSVCELGSNIGLNLIALHTLLPDAELTGVEINEKAAEQLKELPYVTPKCSSIYDIDIGERQYDLVFTKGVLIHQDPAMLPEAYNILYHISRRYIMVCEYYNPTPVEVEYRGNKSVLFKRDFAGELMDRYPDLKLLDYGFTYHKDNHFLGGDDSNWFLLEKEAH